MRRRVCIALFVLLAIAAPALEAQTAGKVQRVGVLALSDVGAGSQNLEVFRKRLGELGYRDGENVRYEQRMAAGRERLPAMAGELVALKVDAILAIGTDAALAAKQATTTIPVVFVGVGEPVAGDNVTGLTDAPREVIGKLAGYLKEVKPRLKRVVVLTNRKNPGAASVIQEAKSAGQALGVRIDVTDLPRAEDAAAVFSAVAKTKPDGVVVTLAAPITPAKAAELALKTRLPAIHQRREFTEAGGLMSYGAKRPDMYRLAAGYMFRVLRGAKPKALPVAEPASFELLVNLQTAKTLRLAVPQSVLAHADEVIR
jgi:putative ABC transport system substrate-binding protein